MSQSVSALLLLSRDAPSDPATWEVVEVDGVLRGLVEGAVAAKPALRIGSAIEGVLPVAGDRYQLNALFASIIENATHYTPDGGSVTVTAGVRDSDVEVEVADSGVGFTETERAHAFDRFYRGQRRGRCARKAPGWASQSPGVSSSCTTGRWRSGKATRAGRRSAFACHWWDRFRQSSESVAKAFSARGRRWCAAGQPRPAHHAWSWPQMRGPSSEHCFQ